MNLPEELEQQFQEELKAFEEARQMRYMATWERRAKLEERQAIARRLLQQGLPIEAIAQATELSIAQIEALQAEAEQN